MSKKVIIFYAIFDVLIITLGAGLCAYSVKFHIAAWLASSQAGFFCSLMIVYFSYRAYESKMMEEIQSGKYDDIENLLSDDLDDKSALKELKKEKISSNFTGTFFSPLKILSYFVLITAIYDLMKYDLLSPLAIMLGVSVIPIGTLVYAFNMKD